MKSKNLLLPLAAFSTIASTAIASEDQRPNIVILFADDLGYSDIGCYGGEINTPNLNQLAEDGIRLTRFMNNAKSAPSRASLLTGLHAIVAGCSGSPAQMQNGLTIGELLQQNGYETLMCGKWHASENPSIRGFDRYYGSVAGGSNYFSPMNTKFMYDGEFINPINQDNKDTFYTTDAYTDMALNYLDDHKKSSKEPFLLYVAYNAPHFPLQAWEEDIAKYRGKYMKGWDKLREERFKRQKEMGLIPKDAELSQRDEVVQKWEDFERKDDADRTMATYAAMVDRMDQNIGRILSKLDEIGESDNTLVLFFSDNGGNAEGSMWNGTDAKGKPGIAGSNAKLGDEWANLSNTPFRKFKRYMYNGGVQSPFIARFPKEIKDKGAIIDQPAHIVDIFPTIMNLAEAKYPEGETWKVEGGANLKKEWKIQPLAGEDIMPILRGDEVKQREIFLGYFQGARMVINGDWKLVSDGGEGTVQHLYDYPWELYNTKDDVTELNNLVEKYPNLVDSLDKIHRNWITESDRVSNITSHRWFPIRFTSQQQTISDALLKDSQMIKLLDERRVIGEKIVETFEKSNFKLKTALGMEKVPVAYFGYVAVGNELRNKTPELSNLYDQWDAATQKCAKYCSEKGDNFAEVWSIQERIRKSMPKTDLK